MKLLLDAGLSPRIADLLNQQGIESVHVREHGLQHVDDDSIFGFATEGDHVLISEGTDFGEILALCNANRPSVILLRPGEPLTPTSGYATSIQDWLQARPGCGARPRADRVAGPGANSSQANGVFVT